MDVTSPLPVDTKESQEPKEINTAASTSTSSLPSPVRRSNSQSSLNKSSIHVHSHRASFAENLRNAPPSPRAHRQPSFTQAAIQDLLNHPPSSEQPNPKFANREWRDISVAELVSKDDVKWSELDTSVEDASMALLHSPRNVVLIREDASSNTAVSTFDHGDLNSYLLVVVGLAKPEDDNIEVFNAISQKAQARETITLREIQQVCRRDDIVTLPADAKLEKAMEIFGSGIHRLLVLDENSEVLGILSQLRLVEFFWNEAINFPAIDWLYPHLLRDLGIGSQKIIAINADNPLADALTLMNTEGLSSVAVVDNGLNVVGNISSVDVKHLTSAASAPLLKSSCMHFISVILSERGMEKGRDSYPVFYVNPYSTLAHTVAKLVATRSHRMWVVESASPSPSAPATPQLNPTVIVPGSTSTPQSPQPVPSAVPASAMPGAHLSGKLTGVISLTDILNLFAKSTGLRPSDPGEQRAKRRKSSSSSMRPSLDSSRPSLDVRR
ncbi:cbs domain containing protein [Zalerion maritima]|uniref:Protein SDS23 n=1 Tax=Zalerion maritima TaxID=339359 RepID=A0AAD5RSC5_9PEZI|nr:cbs domain containing protein [Zalerion maritima]